MGVSQNIENEGLGAVEIVHELQPNLQNDLMQPRTRTPLLFELQFRVSAERVRAGGQRLED